MITLDRRWRCRHRSHRLHLPCLRPWTYDGYCHIHNRSCFVGCPEEEKT